MKFQVFRSAIVHLRGHRRRCRKRFLMSAQADNRFAEDPDFNLGDKTKSTMNTQNDVSLTEEPEDDLDDESRPEYTREDLKNGVRGKYLAQFRSGTNHILLDPDVAKVFPTAQAVNEALRRLMQSQPPQTQDKLCS